MSAPVVDFQHPSPTRRSWVAVFWLLAALLLFNTWEDWQRLQYQQQLTDEREQHFIQLTRQQEQLIQAAIRLSPVQKQQLAVFAQQSATPFALLDALGQAWSHDVAITRLDVTTQTQLLTLDLEVRALPDAFRFVERLKALPELRVTLQQSARKPNDPQRPMLVKLSLAKR
ncbi:hypothetical protein DYL61_01890 [Pseudomonas nabeulensis]|uniref:Uncharacterized protein n=1 Tax=Pseudomonas nabeulensis TaxID=2293833 RepID=A0A4Z0B9Q1_9PSED|nr:hypothetical protein [Pseudomonas nabeulensis]TFY95746.1 hypothetical protein DYL61_01890 [Pseudomonas nabeulensis]